MIYAAMGIDIWQIIVNRVDLLGESENHRRKIEMADR